MLSEGKEPQRMILFFKLILTEREIESEQGRGRERGQRMNFLFSIT